MKAKITAKYIGHNATISTVRSVLKNEPTERGLVICQKIIDNRSKILWIKVDYENGNSKAYPEWRFNGGEELQTIVYEILSRQQPMERQQ